MNATYSTVAYFQTKIMTYLAILCLNLDRIRKVMILMLKMDFSKL